jgi:hypothetical protein
MPTTLTDIGLRNDGDGVRLPDHVILNFPFFESPSFLGALRWWPVMKPPKRKPYKTSTNSSSGTKVAGTDADAGRLFLRARVHDACPRRPRDRSSAEEVAIDLVASNLLPRRRRCQTKGRANDEHDCCFTTHPVRDVACKRLSCVSFSAATPKLLRYMQGDFLTKCLVVNCCRGSTDLGLTTKSGSLL